MEQEHKCSTCELPIEEKVHTALQKITAFKRIKLECQKIIMVYDQYTKHTCHDGWCWGFFKENGYFDCNHEERCNCFEINNKKTYSYEKFRLDFYVEPKNRPGICIECDGEEYHDESKDKERDAWLLKNKGIETIRLDGSTIHSSSVRSTTPSKIP